MNIKELDGRLSERKGNENSNKGWIITMEGSEKCSATGISFGTNNCSSICEWHGRRVSSYISLSLNYAQLLRKIGNYKDCEELQNNVNMIY